MRLSLLSASDVQNQLAQALRARRKAQGLSRAVLAERSAVPPSTIKRFELSGEISLRQFLLLWQSLDDLRRVAALCDEPASEPKSLDEVLRT